MALYNAPQHHSHTLRYGGHDPGVCCRAFGSNALWALGYPDQALRRSHEGLNLCQSLSHPFSTVLSLYWLASLYQLRREGASAQERAEEANALATKHGLPLYAAWAEGIRGWALAQQGREDEGIAQIRQGLDAYRATGAALDQTHLLALLAEAYARSGRTEAGLRVLAEGLAAVDSTGERHYEAELNRLRGELMLRGDGAEAGIEQAEACFRKAIDVARRQQAKSWELRAVMSLGRLWRQQGKREEARHLLAESYGWFTEGFDTADLKEAKLLLDELS